MYQPCTHEQCVTTTGCRCYTALTTLYSHFSLANWPPRCAQWASGPAGLPGRLWNRLDFFIVIAGLLEYLPQTKDLSLTAIRAIRVLRPLRAINRIPSMRILVMLLLDTLPMLGNVLLLCFFVFFIFGIIGVATFLNLTEYYQSPEQQCRQPSLRQKISSGTLKRRRNGDSNMRPDQSTTSDVGCLSTESSYMVCNRTADHSRRQSAYTTTGAAASNWNQYYSVCNASVS
uniref:Ion_trans domain-containing protein n=1 Tax=Macrostomum lignano TaxID=282301 RepID=A0A1I8FHH3_9PLAT